MTYFRPVTWHEETISSHVSSKGRHQEASLMTFCRSDHFNGITISQVRRNFEGSSQLLMVLQRHDSDGQPTDQNISRGRSTNRARTILKTSIRSMPRMPRPAKFEEDNNRSNVTDPNLTWTPNFTLSSYCSGAPLPPVDPWFALRRP